MEGSAQQLQGSLRFGSLDAPSYLEVAVVIAWGS